MARVCVLKLMKCQNDYRDVQKVFGQKLFPFFILMKTPSSDFDHFGIKSCEINFFFSYPNFLKYSQFKVVSNFGV